MKVFISQPMRDKTDKEILEVRDNVIKYLEITGREDIQVIDSFFIGEYEDASPVKLLGKSIELLADADLVVFVDGWESARGCRIEYEIAKQYGLNMLALGL